MSNAAASLREVHLIWVRRGSIGGSPRFMLAKPLKVLGHCIPEGFETDGATVPPIVRGLLSPFGDYLPAAILHDYLLSSGMERREAAHEFKQALKSLGMPSWITNGFYAAVRVWDHIREAF